MMGVRDAWISAVERGRDGAWAHDCTVSCSPGEVLAEREAAWAAELTPNMAVLGDPLPGRSALDALHRMSQR